MESCKSGNAGVPHVHHETWKDPTGMTNPSLRYDPFQGSCDTKDPSKWTDQNGYRVLPAANCQ
jgi:hypothetical protein